MRKVDYSLRDLITDIPHLFIIVEISLYRNKLLSQPNAKRWINV